jgi:hypothetical protein
MDINNGRANYCLQPDRGPLAILLNLKGLGLAARGARER